jgi:hypothetical protein
MAREVSRSRRKQSAPKPPPITLAEAARLHAGKWFVIQVTAFDENERPTEGRVVATAKGTQAVYNKLHKLEANDRQEGLRIMYGLYHAGPLPEYRRFWLRAGSPEMIGEDTDPELRMVVNPPKREVGEPAI